MKIRLQCRLSAAGRSLRPSTTPGEAGGSLAQLLGTVAAFGLMAAALGWATSAGFSLIQSTRGNLQASQIVMERAESGRLFTGSQVCDANNSRKPLFVQSSAPNPLGGVQCAAYLSTPHASPAAQPPKLRTATVTVYWTNCTGIVQQREIKAVLARNGAPKYLWGAL